MGSNHPFYIKSRRMWKDNQNHYKVNSNSQFQMTSTAFPENSSLFLGFMGKADSQTVLAFKQFTVGKKVILTIPCDKFNRYIGCRINAYRTMGTGATEKTLQSFKTYASFWRMGRACQAEKVRAVFWPEKTTMQRQRSVKDRIFREIYEQFHTPSWAQEKKQEIGQKHRPEPNQIAKGHRPGRIGLLLCRQKVPEKGILREKRGKWLSDFCFRTSFWSGRWTKKGKTWARKSIKGLLQ